MPDIFITLNYMDDDTLNNYIGNKSKKKYLSGEIIIDNTLSLIEFLDVNCNSELYKDVEPYYMYNHIIKTMVLLCTTDTDFL